MPPSRCCGTTPVLASLRGQPSHGLRTRSSLSRVSLHAQASEGWCGSGDFSPMGSRRLAPEAGGMQRTAADPRSGRLLLVAVQGAGSRTPVRERPASCCRAPHADPAGRLGFSPVRRNRGVAGNSPERAKVESPCPACMRRRFWFLSSVHCRSVTGVFHQHQIGGIPLSLAPTQCSPHRGR